MFGQRQTVRIPLSLLSAPTIHLKDLMREIPPVELFQRLQGPEPKPLLLDVREPHEFEYCHIEGSLHMPMNRVFAGLKALDPERDTVVICHHGLRSAQIANFLINHGFKNIANLRGGVAAWAKEIDPSMPTY